jgi:hypothetical protein
MTRMCKGVALLMIGVAALGGCSKQTTGANPKTPGSSKPATPATTASPAPPGSTVAMGHPVLGDNGNAITVYGWRRGANTSVASGPGQVYETVDVGFCAGPTTEQSTRDLGPLFALELPNGNMVVPDSYTNPGEFRTKGTVHPNQCVKGPLVYQVGGGTKPHFVVFSSSKASKWTVP